MERFKRIEHIIIIVESQYDKDVSKSHKIQIDLEVVKDSLWGKGRKNEAKGCAKYNDK